MLAVFVFFGAVAAFLPHAVGAQVDLGTNFAEATGLSTTDVRIMVGRVIKAFLTLLGILAVMLFLYAGFIWMTSAGNPEKIAQAKKIMVNAVIGLVIIVSAYAIASFIINALTGQGGGPGVGSPGGGRRLTALFSGNRGSDQLGNGIIEYHYPEPGQMDVPRNTKIAITFKRPFALSTVFKNYDDKGTFDPTDDELCPSAPPCTGGTPVTASTTLELNTDNFKIIPVQDLGTSGTGSVDEQFDARYPDGAALVDPAPTAKVSSVTVPFDPAQGQTIVIKPVVPIGSPTTDIDYRVALRGGDNGIKVWAQAPNESEPAIANAFASFLYADGSYYWTFTTNTTIDTTPPKIAAVVPQAPSPAQLSSRELDRNQLLQIYFNEAVDPTTASGMIGTGGGFNNIVVEAKCLPGAYPADCVLPNGSDYFVVDGTIFLGNRYRTAEFIPSTECEGIAENSCGEPVYCLPKNVELRVTVRAATIDNIAPLEPEPPEALIENGVLDMVGNSFDGNDNGTAQGPQNPPQPGGLGGAYYRNAPPADITGISDTAYWEYHVGSNVDLVVPVITEIDPPASASPPPPAETDLHPSGPSNVPPELEPTVRWSKTMSVSSMRTGGFNRDTGEYRDSRSTLVLRSNECQKTGTDLCTSSCPCTFVDPPGFFVDAGLPIEDPPSSGTFVTELRFAHPFRPFFTANDLGYTEEDMVLFPEIIPTYVPIVRAQIKDTKQNCFWPSVYRPAPAATECTQGADEYSCCDRVGETDSAFLTACAP